MAWFSVSCCILLVAECSCTYFHTKLNRISELVPRADPIQSIFPFRSTGDSFRLNPHSKAKTTNPKHALYHEKSSPSASNSRLAAYPIQTHMKTKNHFHSVPSMNAPRNNAPKYPPVGADDANRPRLRFRIRPGGLVLAIIATALGMIKAPPRPASARIVTNAKKLWQNAQMSVQMLSHKPPARRSSRWPNTSPSRPLTRTNVPCVSLGFKVSIDVTWWVGDMD